VRRTVLYSSHLALLLISLARAGDILPNPDSPQENLLFVEQARKPVKPEGCKM
jgi:hypothetical protein